jgi:hypothetical protein
LIGSLLMKEMNFSGPMTIITSIIVGKMIWKVILRVSNSVQESNQIRLSQISLLCSSERQLCFRLLLS